MLHLYDQLKKFLQIGTGVVAIAAQASSSATFGSSAWGVTAPEQDAYPPDSPLFPYSVAVNLGDLAAVAERTKVLDYLARAFLVPRPSGREVIRLEFPEDVKPRLLAARR